MIKRHAHPDFFLITISEDDPVLPGAVYLCMNADDGTVMLLRHLDPNNREDAWMIRVYDGAPRPYCENMKDELYKSNPEIAGAATQ